MLRLVRDNAERLATQIGAPLEIGRVLVRDPGRERDPACDRRWLTTSVADVVDDPALDVLVEVMGGEGEAGAHIERALARGVGVVTANKMLLARRGPDLLATAVRGGADLAFEASVGGGIPVIRTLRDALTGDSVERLAGIVNGTCNYMLTRMREEGIGFETALAEAQRLGYAEAEPSLDVDGHDAAQKLVVLAMLAFGARVNEADVPVTGIRAIDAEDHRLAARFGYRIKHLAIGHDHGTDLELRVHPALVPEGDTLASVSGVLNALRVEGRALGPCLLSGRGAGAMPTAVSVVADLADVARARRAGAGGLATRGIRAVPRTLRPLSAVETPFYLRFSVHDRPGVLSAIAGSLGENGVSIEQMVQIGSGGQAPVRIVMLTHRACWGGVSDALAAIARQSFVAEPSRLLPIAVGA